MESNSGLTLTQTAHFGRLFVKYGLIALVVLIVGRTFLTAAFSYWRAVNPPAPPPPSVGFGALPAIQFPSQSASDKPASYQLETPTGGFPSFGDRAKVFLMLKSTPSLLADQRVKEIAANYGFVFQPSVLNSRTYRWTKSTPLQATLEMDIQNNNFTIETNYLSKPELLGRENLPDNEDAVRLAKAFLSSGVDMPKDLATASGKVSYLKALGSEVAPAVSFSDADFIQVDVGRSPIDGLFSFYSPKGNGANISAILSGAFTGEDQVVHYEFHYQPIDYTEFHTYPLRSPESAWQVLQAGEGYIAKKGNTSAVVVRDVFLGYYDDFSEQEYLQPVYVFAGDGGFLGYVPAIDPRFMQQAGQAASTQK